MSWQRPGAAAQEDEGQTIAWGNQPRQMRCAGISAQCQPLGLDRGPVGSGNSHPARVAGLLGLALHAAMKTRSSSFPVSSAPISILRNFLAPPDWLLPILLGHWSRRRMSEPADPAPPESDHRQSAARGNGPEDSPDWPPESSWRSDRPFGGRATTQGCGLGDYHGFAYPRDSRESWQRFR